MNLKDAYSILELPQGATPEEAKKKYRELTKKFHPDINKEAGAEDKFKKINEAYQVVSTGKSTDREDVFSARQNPFNPFGRQHIIYTNPIEISTTISFKEAVLGCSKEIKFKRNTKCRDCGGQGETPLDNGCVKCKGKGQVVMQRGSMVFIQTCDKCYGKVKTTTCSFCNGDGFVGAEASINVSIPGGRQNGDILRLAGMGNYTGNFGPIEQYTDAHLHVVVTPEPGLTLSGSYVVAAIRVSLLESLKGCTKHVNTIDGFKEVEVKPLSRHKEEITIPKLGVNRMGDQKVIVNVVYPDDVTDLIEFLSKKES